MDWWKKLPKNTNSTMIHLHKANIIPCIPEISSYIVARDARGEPCVYVVRGWKDRKPVWIVRHRLSHPVCYMFKDTGEFGYTEDEADIYENSFHVFYTKSAFTLKIRC